MMVAEEEEEEQVLSLTGATLTSDDGIEMSETNAHSHSHNHHGRPCCSSPTPMQSMASVSTEQVLLWDSAKIFERLVEICRRGDYSLFEPIVQGLSAELRRDLLNKVGQDGPSLLHWAAKRVDDVRFLTLLLKHVEVNTLDLATKDDTRMMPLHWTCTEGSVPLAALLLKEGASLEARDQSGCTPLLIAAQYGHVELVAFLLQKGADGRAIDHSWDSALHWAAYKGSVQVCGLLLFRGELSWTAVDKFGQTPLHLASIRGETAVVRYLLQEGSAEERRQVLSLTDKNGKTPLDLAIHRQRRNVEVVLRNAMQDKQGSIASILRQLCSLHSWELWMGMHSVDDQVDESPKFPFYFMLVHVLLCTLWYPVVFLPVTSTSQGVLWDLPWWNFFQLLLHGCLWFSIYKTKTTNPGLLDESHQQTAELRRRYEITLESYSDEDSFAKRMPLCHTCHISKPLRSKHCRVARRCVLLFDHHCPFVGNTIGLYNYKWFYLVLLSMSLAVISFVITLGIYLHRKPEMEWFKLIGGIYLGLFLLPAGGMCIYHTQLMMVNLTTNEHQNVRRYPYLFNDEGHYHNPFFRGYLGNIMDRFFPSTESYTLQEQQMPLLRHDEV